MNKSIFRVWGRSGPEEFSTLCYVISETLDSALEYIKKEYPTFVIESIAKENAEIL